MNVVALQRRVVKGIGALALPVIVAACGGGGSGGAAPPGQPSPSPSPPPAPPPITLQYTIDATVKPMPETLGTRSLGAVRDERGTTSTFVLDELLISPADAAELDAFVRRTGARVLRSDAVPEPPPGAGINMDAQYRQATQYVVRVDTSAVDLGAFTADASRAGFAGNVRISSEAAARLLALAARERVAGARVSPNFVGLNQGLLFETEEHPIDASRFISALGLSRFAAAGSRSNVARAWQWIAAHGGFTPVRVAIIDGGFWLDPLGRPRSSLASLTSDLPVDPLQYDFDDDDRIADGENPARCTGGSVCRWHGNASAGVAVGLLNNRYGTAGTGGQVAEPMLFKTALSHDQVARAIRTAAAWRAAVISMSFSAECDNVFCDGYFEFNLYPALRHARDRNVVLVAAAGNNAQDTNTVPCKAEGEGVICVGALADDDNVAIGYSNFGSKVDIWAPTNILTMPDGDTAPSLKTAGGTSAATPFVAGIAAMLKAYDPSLGSAQVRDILRRTAWTDSPDPKVTHYVNAYAALRAVVGEDLPPDRLEPNDSSLNPTAVAGSPILFEGLNLHRAADRDHLRIVLTQHSNIVVSLRYLPQYGAPDLILVPDSPSSFGATEVSRTPRADGSGFTYRATVAPGSYRLVVAGDRAKPYDLEFSHTPRSLMTDAFEVNDTLATAAALPSPGSGDFFATLHNSADTDYFRLTDLSTVFQTVRFDVTTREMPLALRLFNDAGTQIAAASCTPVGACRVDLPVGSLGVHRVNVQGLGITGRYTFQASRLLNRAQIPVAAFPTEPLIVIDEGAPAMRGLLNGQRNVYVFMYAGKSGFAFLSGTGLALRLYEASGKFIAAGQPGSSPQLPIRIPLQGLQTQQVYVLEVERTDQPLDIDNEREVLAPLGYLLGLGN